MDRKIGTGADGRALRQRSDIVMDAIRSAEAAAAAEGRQASRSSLRWPAAAAATDAWLKEQGRKHGFSVEACSLRAYRTVRLRRGGRRRGAGPDFGVAQVEGLLTVGDPHAFARKVFIGFGRAKAFGCGLMLLSRGAPPQGAG